MSKPAPVLASRYPARQRGAALLMAMVIVTLVATLAASMVWQQWRAVQVEGAERVRAQAGWILRAATDFARLVLRSDGQAQGRTTDDLTEEWAKPIAESRISSLLATDRENNASDDSDIPDAFLSGRMSDAQAKYNLRRLVDGNGAPVKDEVDVFKRLLSVLGIGPSLAGLVADTMSRAVMAEQSLATSDVALLEKLGGETGRAQAPLMPQTYDQLLSMMDGATLEKLRPYVTLNPDSQTTPVNINTAPAEVLAAAIDGLDLAGATRLVQARQRQPFKAVSDIEKVLGKGPSPNGWGLTRVDVKTEYFEIVARIRYEDNVLEDRSLVKRDANGNVVVLQQSRFSGQDKAAGAGPSP
jgi:general secretion pathway protein K